MSSKNKIAISGLIATIVAIALIASVVFVPGAGILSQNSNDTGTLGVQLTDPPIVPAGVTNVYISYSEMAVHVADAGNYSGWYKIAPAGEIDLMSVLTTSITLGSSQVKSGIYNAIGFNITSATVTANGINESAYISNHHLLVPLVGGVEVGVGTSEGILLDLSPTVLAVTNGTQTAYVLLPNAQALHLPRAAWQQAEQKGEEIKDIQQAAWFYGVRGDIAPSAGALSANSVSVTIKNDGLNSTMVTSLSVYYPLTVICRQYNAQCSSSPYGDALPRSIPLALFGVLSNGTLLQYNFTASAIARYTGTGAVDYTAEIDQQGVHLGYVLSPGQSVTFSFKGPISTITSNILSYMPVNVAVPQNLIQALTQINPGQQYFMVGRGLFGTFGYEQVTAS
ncbi:MAG TPA: DUF4382 domain-containing protein [Nitrososphaerales archaeon]|nr:DUF4382 domain-containing protein [Nitrososphaerales archaeon]